MRKRIIAFLLIFSMLVPPLVAEPIEYEYEPYTEEEFPIWAHELRRAESIFFGSLAITFPLSMGGQNTGAIRRPTVFWLNSC